MDETSLDETAPKRLQDVMGNNCIEVTTDKTCTAVDINEGSKDVSGLSTMKIPAQRETRKRKKDNMDESSSSDANDDSVHKVAADTKGEKGSKRKNITKREEGVYRWSKQEPPKVDDSFKGQEFKEPPEFPEEITPLTYFKGLLMENIIEHIAEQTNQYSVQQTGRRVNTNKEEIEVFIGIQIRMSIVRMSVYRHYWATGTRYAPIAYAMARCNTIDKEHILSIDEQIVPAKTKRSGLRQYTPRKPVKGGSRCLVRCIRSHV